MALPAIGQGEQVGDGNLGEVLNVGRAGQPLQIGGTNTGTVGFFGATPVVQPTTSLDAAVLSTAAISSAATNGGWLFSTSTQANGLVTLVNSLRADLVSLGIIKGS